MSDFDPKAYLENFPEPEDGVWAESTIEKARLQTGPGDEYGKVVRGYTRLFWRGDMSPEEFDTAMSDHILLGLGVAFNRAMRDCGLQPEEATDRELNALRTEVNANLSRLGGLIEFIGQHSRAEGWNLSSIATRVEMWANRYNAVYSEIRTYACGDKKLKWVWTPEKEHCEDCAKMNGRVYRASIWAKYGIKPQSRSLACGGFLCGCHFEETDEPVTPGRPPAIRGKS